MFKEKGGFETCWVVGDLCREQNGYKEGLKKANKLKSPVES